MSRIDIRFPLDSFVLNTDHDQNHALPFTIEIETYYTDFEKTATPNFTEKLISSNLNTEM